jgi:hypothetical protein
MSERPTAVQMLEPARITRERVEHFVPQILYVPRNGRPQFVAADGEGSAPEAVGAVLAQVRAAHGPAEWIAVTVDAYAKNFAEDPGFIARGELSEAFAEGDPAVVEQMIVILVDRYKGVEVASQNYRYLPSEGWEWSEPDTRGEFDGDLMKTIKFYM